jgi:exosortase/archaeosortase family protein
VGVLVLAGNVLRNSVLVVLEAQQEHVLDAVHQGVGLAVLLMVCSAVMAVIHGGRDARA